MIASRWYPFADIASDRLSGARDTVMSSGRSGSGTGSDAAGKEEDDGAADGAVLEAAPLLSSVTAGKVSRTSTPSPLSSRSSPVMIGRDSDADDAS